MDISGRDGHLACASVLNACPYPGKKIGNCIKVKINTKKENDRYYSLGCTISKTKT